jgi:hypothetical protein
MPTHCSLGDKPIIKYRFKDDTKDRIFKSKYAPIEVITKPLPLEASDGYRAEGFQLTTKEFAASTPVSNLYVDFKLWYFPASVNHPTGKGITGLNCGKKWSEIPRNLEINPYTGGYTSNYLYEIISIDYSKKCPTPNSERCSIEIKYNGLIIFQDQGKCPVDYSIQCGKCPDGQHECESKVYPYYCCSSCADTAQKIKELASKVGR